MAWATLLLSVLVGSGDVKSALLSSPALLPLECRGLDVERWFRMWWWMKDNRYTQYNIYQSKPCIRMPANVRVVVPPPVVLLFSPLIKDGLCFAAKVLDRKRTKPALSLLHSALSFLESLGRLEGQYFMYELTDSKFAGRI